MFVVAQGLLLNSLVREFCGDIGPPAAGSCQVKEYGMTVLGVSLQPGEDQCRHASLQPDQLGQSCGMRG